MNKAEVEHQIHTVCRMRRLSLHTDKEAKDHVQRKAQEGSAYHIDALARTQLL